MKFIKALIVLTICCLSLCGCSTVKEETKTTQLVIEVEEQVEMTIINKYEKDNKFYIVGLNLEKDLSEVIEVKKEKFETWELGDYYTIGVSYTYTV